VLGVGIMGGVVQRGAPVAANAGSRT
jgi:hypothetical protein